MKKLREITSNILQYFLKIHKDDIVLIASDIYNKDPEAPLTEMPMVEALALELINRKAYPILNMGLQSIQETLREDSGKSNGLIPDKLNRNLMDTIDLFIEVGWKKLSQEILTPHEQLKSSRNPQIFFWHKVFEHKKDLVFINYPTPELSNYLGTKYDKLRRSIKRIYKKHQLQLRNFEEQSRRAEGRIFLLRKLSDNIGKREIQDQDN